MTTILIIVYSRSGISLLPTTSRKWYWLWPIE